MWLKQGLKILVIRERCGRRAGGRERDVSLVASSIDHLIATLWLDNIVHKIIG